MKKILWTIMVVLFVAVAISACSSDEFPYGTYTRQNQMVEYRDDGTFTYMFSGEVVTEGTFTIDGDEILWMKDTWCDAENAGSATYKWHHEDGALSFELVGEDFCEGRRGVMSYYWFGPK